MPYMALVVKGGSLKGKVLGSLKQFMSANNQLQLAIKQMYEVVNQAKIYDEDLAKAKSGMVDIVREKEELANKVKELQS